jgi:hypothetical protein
LWLLEACRRLVGGCRTLQRLVWLLEACRRLVGGCRTLQRLVWLLEACRRRRRLSDAAEARVALGGVSTACRRLSDAAEARVALGGVSMAWRRLSTLLLPCCFVWRLSEEETKRKGVRSTACEARVDAVVAVLLLQWLLLALKVSLVGEEAAPARLLEAVAWLSERGSCLVDLNSPLKIEAKLRGEL